MNFGIRWWLLGPSIDYFGAVGDKDFDRVNHFVSVCTVLSILYVGYSCTF